MNNPKGRKLKRVKKHHHKFGEPKVIETTISDPSSYLMRYLNSLEGQHFGYCHFTFKNRVSSWTCCCDIIRGYLAWCELHEQEAKKLKYDDNASGGL